MSKEIYWYRTCKSCGHDNPDNANSCNSCARSLTGVFSDNYNRRWACPECPRINMADNSKCICGFDKSSCYLTTACVDFAGLPDNCDLLVAMRKLRDCHVAKQPNGNELISEYYSVSPEIVSAINERTDYAKIYAEMLTELSEIKDMVDGEDYKNAASAYTSMYLRILANVGISV
jgi:hypothetical protein